MNGLLDFFSPEATRAVFTRRIPLLSPAPGLLSYTAMQPQEEQY